MKTISYQDYLQIVGLMALAKHHNDMLAQIEETAGRLLGEEKEYGQYGHISDQVFCREPDADTLLKKMEITVQPVVKMVGSNG